jgi:hypothetical protein
MKLMSIQNVSENDLIGIEFLCFLPCLFLAALVGNMFIMMTFSLRKNQSRKKAESRYQQAFDTFSNHTVPEICRKDKGAA